MHPQPAYEVVHAAIAYMLPRWLRKRGYPIRLHEDLIAAGYLAGWRAYNSYDQDKDTENKGIILWCTTRAVYGALDEVRRMNPGLRRSRHTFDSNGHSETHESLFLFYNPLSLSSEIIEDLSTPDVCFNHLVFRTLIEELKALPPRIRDAFVLTTAECAEKYQISESRVSQLRTKGKMLLAKSGSF